MDSRPAMAIFELLDYIVNEVCAIGLQVLLSANCPPPSPAWHFLGEGCERSSAVLVSRKHQCGPAYASTVVGSIGRGLKACESSCLESSSGARGWVTSTDTGGGS